MTEVQNGREAGKMRAGKIPLCQKGEQKEIGFPLVLETMADSGGKGKAKHLGE